MSGIRQTAIGPGRIDVLMGLIRQYRKPVDLFVVRSGDSFKGVLRSAAWGSAFVRAAASSPSIHHVGTYTPDVPAEYVRDDLAEFLGEGGA